MYKITIRTQIHSNCSSVSSSDRFVERQEEIPFPPFVGLMVDWDIGSATITEVMVKNTGNSQKILCYAGEDKRLWHGGSMNVNYERLDAIVAEYVENGWTTEPLSEKEMQRRARIMREVKNG